MTDTNQDPSSPARQALDAFFSAIAVIDPARIAALFAEDGEIEDPIGAPILCGPAEIEQSFATGLATMVRSADVRTVAAFEAGPRIAAHWTMRATGMNGRVVSCDGIDVLTVNDRGAIVRVEGYWDAAAFVRAISG